MTPMNKALIYLTLGALTLTACNQDEDPIVPSGDYSVLRFEFPQGDNDFDMDIKAIHDTYGVYLIYKDVTLADINRRWTSLGTGNLYKGDAVPDEYVPFYVNFFKNHIFANISPEIASNALPVKIYMLENWGIYDPNNPEDPDTGSGTDNSSIVTTVTNGFDYWALSFTRNGIKENNKESLRVARCSFLYQMIKKAYQDGIIKESTAIREKLDLKTSYSKTVGDPNHYLNRGIPYFLYENFIGRTFPPCPAEDKTATFYVANVANSTATQFYFLLHIRTAMFFTRDEMQQKYAEYPLILEIYDDIVKYMMNVYGIDLEGICAGPQE